MQKFSVEAELKLTDEFGQEFKGISSSMNLEEESHNHFESLILNIRQALYALNFTENQINEFIKPIC